MRKIIALILLWILTGCVKEVEWPVEQTGSGILIVDAILSDAPTNQKVTISYPVKELNQKPQPATGATVLVSNEDSTWNFAESRNGTGLYEGPAGFVARSDKNYTLFISLSGKVYSAKAKMVDGTVFKELQYVKNNGDDLFHIDWVASAFDAEKAAMWEVFLDWSHVEGYTQADSASTHARMLFYTLPTLDVSEIFAPEMELISFPAGTTITENRYSLTPEHAEFARELLLETNWAGGFFNVASSDVSTNLSAGAKGFFGVCGVTTLSITVVP
jgi:hypothetical protein